MAAKNMAPKHNEFIPLKIAVLTVSDSRTAADDSSGDYLVSALTEAGHQLTDRALCPDNLFRIRAQVSDWIVDDGVQVVLINGGTGFNEQNRVPEAVGVLFERTMQGFGEMFRQLSFAEISERYALDFKGYFAQDLALLRPFIEDGLMAMDEAGIRVSSTGRLLIRNICMCFDTYLRERARQQQFSRVI